MHGVLRLDAAQGGCMSGVSMERLRSIRSATEALELTWKGSGLDPKEVAGRLVSPEFPGGVGYDHFVRMFRQHDRRHFPPELIEVLMRECDSVLFLEWLAWRMGYALHERSLSSVLVAIRDALLADGRAPRFTINESGRVEVDHG